MRGVTIGLLAAVSLALLPATAAGGGWATAGLAPPPADTAAGETWKARITIRQHGRTPLAGAKPTVTIRNETSGRTATFPAHPTGEVGVYEALVTFPAAGRWSYEVYDGFTQYRGARTHHFTPVTITGGSGNGADAPFFPLWPTLAGLALIAALALAFAALRRSSVAPALR